MKQIIDFQQIRLDHDLFILVERYLGQPKQGKWLCPFHREKTPSFTVNEDHFKCFGCGLTGDVTDFVAMMNKIDIKDAAKILGGYLLDLGLSKDQIKAKQDEIREEYERREMERHAEEQRQCNEALERIAGMNDKVDWYHSQVDQARPYWYSQGLNDDTIERYHLGYCPSCPTCQNSPSYVIPYFANNKLISIRHRLANPNGSGKYRPEFVGLPSQLFNTDILRLKITEEIPFGILDPGQVILVEGEIKAIYLNDVIGMPTAGVPGASAWRDEWGQLFDSQLTVFVAYDPNANEMASKTAKKLSNIVHRVYQVSLPSKPDDFFVLHKGNVDDFMGFLRWGRLVK